MRYAMIIETGKRNYSAYLPDLPGCVATGETIEEVRQRMREAIELHLAGMREDGLPGSNTARKVGQISRIISFTRFDDHCVTHSLRLYFFNPA